MSEREDELDLPDEPDFAVTVAQVQASADDDAQPTDEAPPLALLPTIGHVGRYALKQQLGVGGLGTVHAALDPLLGRAIAVKTLHLDPMATQGQSLEALLLHEARAAAALSHPHIVTVYDAGLAPEGVYIAMERLQGRDLRHLLADGWRPTPQDAALIVRRVADALAYAHSRGVIHCDIKPANIFMVGRAQPKVLDFGIARVAHAEVSLRQAGDGAAAARTVLGGGSPYYMAPEQLRGEPIDVRCDVYALGTVLYELLTARRPFQGQTLDDIRDAVLTAPFVTPRQRAPGVPAALSAVVECAMARDPEHRYRSARALSRALRQALVDAPAAPRRRSGRATPIVALGATSALAVAAVLWYPQAPSPVVPPSQAAAPSVTDAPAAAPAEPARVLVAAPSAEAGTGLPDAAAPRRAQRDKRPSRGPAVTPAADLRPTTTPATGVLQLAVTPWGEVEVNGAAAGTTPPLARLTLPVGTHTVVIRNQDFPPHRTTVTVGEDRAATVRHRFGS
jgi:hypothetical protein